MDTAPGPREPTGDAGDAGSDAGGAGNAAVDLAVAFVPGVLPGKWFFRWRDRHPGRVLAERPLEGDAWREELAQGRAHACFVRLPAHPRAGRDDLATLRRDLWAVELYAERQVVVLPRDHELTLLDEVPVAELVGEVLLQEPAALPELQALRPPVAAATDAPLPPVRRVRDTIELVAAGLGLVVVPMSVARLHHRRDLVHRVVPDAATVPVLLVWPRDLPGEQEELVQDFVGVVRGRGRDSSRGAATPPSPDRVATTGARRGRTASPGADSGVSRRPRRPGSRTGTRSGPGRRGRR